MEPVNIEQYMNALASKRFDPSMSLGRRREDGPYEGNPGVDPFTDDHIRIANSKTFRRLGDKMQVFCAPKNMHIRTRLAHSLEVGAHSMYAADILGLNRKLCMAVAVGHDGGHCGYGHFGEEVLSERGEHEFRHNVASVVVFQHVEREGLGLNLTYETLSGILNHSRWTGPMGRAESVTEEANLVMFCDKIGYTFSDLNDAIRMELLTEDDIPREAQELGSNQRERQAVCAADLVRQSAEADYVCFERGPVVEAFNALRDFMYREVYPQIYKEVLRAPLEATYEFISTAPEFEGVDPVLLTSILTDTELNRIAERLREGPPLKREDFRKTSLAEVVPAFKLMRKGVKHWDPDLDWAHDR